MTERQLQEAIQHQVLYGGRLGTSLYELGYVTEERLQGGAQPRPRRARRGHPEGSRRTPPALLPKKLAARHKVFPLELRGKTLFLGMVDPADHSAVAQVGYSQGYIVRPLVVPEFRMIQLLYDHYGVDERWRFTDTHRRGAPPPREDLDVPTAAARLDAAESRDEVVETVLAVCHRFFRRVIFFIVREPWVARVERARGRDGQDPRRPPAHPPGAARPSSAPSPATRACSSGASARKRRTSASWSRWASGRKPTPRSSRWR